VDGRELADHVQGIQLVRLHHEHRLFRHDDDQLHHECGGHRHLPAGGPGDRALPGRAGEVILFASLVVAGMPFLLLVGAAPNAIAYDSKQFTTGEFFLWGIPASIILMIVTAFAVKVLWPIMGMPISTGGYFMQTTAEGECIDHEATLDIAIHTLVLGNHLSLMVTKDKQIIGVLRLSDVFAAVFHSMKECSV
jgi:hypothetical protein